MDKKASIVTFHCVPNYGAVLQTYAMQEYLKRHYDCVDVVDYRPESLTAEYKYLSFYSVFSFVKTAWSFPSFCRKRRNFQRFEKQHITLAKPGNLDTDMLVLGSDQIWNSKITKGLDPVYFGQISCAKKPAVVSYAASVGEAQLSEEDQAFFREALGKIDRISVREAGAKKLLQPLTDKPIHVVADPTILAGAESFRPLIKPVEKKPYVFVYSLLGYPETENMARKVAKYLGLPVVELSGRRKALVKKDHTVVYTAGPEEFLSLIAGAEYVVTDSFHGTAFSLLFHKPFVTIPHKTRNGRVQGLLDICELSERLITAYDRDVVNASVDWDAVDGKLAALRLESEKFLAEGGAACDRSV